MHIRHVTDRPANSAIIIIINAKISGVDPVRGDTKFKAEQFNPYTDRRTEYPHVKGTQPTRRPGERLLPPPDLQGTHFNSSVL